MAVPVDRFSLLPAELRLRIYTFVFSPNGELITLQINHSFRGKTVSGSGLVLLVRNEKYYARRRPGPLGTWPDHVEEAFWRGTISRNKDNAVH